MDPDRPGSDLYCDSTGLGQTWTLILQAWVRRGPRYYKPGSYLDPYSTSLDQIWTQAGLGQICTVTAQAWVRPGPQQYTKHKDLWRISVNECYEYHSNKWLFTVWYEAISVWLSFMRETSAAMLIGIFLWAIVQLQYWFGISRDPSDLMLHFSIDCSSARLRSLY